jgi:hypothetical protein
MRCWLDKNTGKWNWIFFDGDAGFGNPEFNSFEHAVDVSDNYWPNNKNSTLFFRELSKNSRFSQAFINRLNELLVTEFRTESFEHVFDKIFTEISPSIEMQISRFNFPESTELWSEICLDRKKFLLYRPCTFVKHTEEYFNVKLPDYNCTQDDWDAYIMEIFPIPAQSEITVVAKSEFIGMAVLSITDILGRIVFSKTVFINSSEFIFNIDIAGLQNGIYMLNLKYNNSITGKQIVIMR